jgi:hypothetical protein
MHDSGAVRAAGSGTHVEQRHCEERSDDPPSLAMRAMAGLESAEAPLRVGGSNPSFLCAVMMDCFAEPVIGRAFARPVGSQ